MDRNQEASAIIKILRIFAYTSSLMSFILTFIMVGMYYSMTDQDNKHIIGLINYLDYNVNTLPIKNISTGEQCGYL